MQHLGEGIDREEEIYQIILHKGCTREIILTWTGISFQAMTDTLIWTGMKMTLTCLTRNWGEIDNMENSPASQILQHIDLRDGEEAETLLDQIPSHIGVHSPEWTHQDTGSLTLSLFCQFCCQIVLPFVTYYYIPLGVLGIGQPLSLIWSVIYSINFLIVWYDTVYMPNYSVYERHKLQWILTCTSSIYLKFHGYKPNLQYWCVLQYDTFFLPNKYCCTGMYCSPSCFSCNLIGPHPSNSHHIWLSLIEILSSSSSISHQSVGPNTRYHQDDRHGHKGTHTSGSSGRWYMFISPLNSEANNVGGNTEEQLDSPVSKEWSVYFCTNHVHS